MSSKRKEKAVPERASGPFIVGRSRFATISAVEDVAIGEVGKRRFLRMDRQGLSAEQRRRIILEAYSKSST